MADLDDQLITLEHVRDLLPVLRLGPAQQRRLLALPYPVPFAVVAREFTAAGVSTDELVDRMGGSP